MNEINQLNKMNKINQINQLVEDLLKDPYDSNTEIIGMILSLNPELSFNFLDIISRRIGGKYYVLYRQLNIYGINIYFFICVRSIILGVPTLEPIERIIIICPILKYQMFYMGLMKISIDIFNRWKLYIEIEYNEYIITTRLIEYAAV